MPAPGQPEPDASALLADLGDDAGPGSWSDAMSYLEEALLHGVFDTDPPADAVALITAVLGRLGVADRAPLPFDEPRALTELDLLFALQDAEGELGGALGEALSAVPLADRMVTVLQALAVDGGDDLDALAAWLSREVADFRPSWRGSGKTIAALLADPRLAPDRRDGLLARWQVSVDQRLEDAFTDEESVDSFGGDFD